MQLLRCVFPDYTEADLLALSEEFMAPRLTVADKLAEIVRENPDMALGIECMMQLDPASATEFKALNNVVKEFMGEKVAAEEEEVEEEVCDPPGEDDEVPIADHDDAMPAIAGPVSPAKVAPPAPSTPSSSSGSSKSSSSSNSSSSSASEGQENAKPSTAHKTRNPPVNNTPACLKQFLSSSRQSISQDVRENRFSARDPWDDDRLEGDLAQNYFSRSYGKKRSPRQALEMIVAWLHRRQHLLGSCSPSPPSLPVVGAESPDLVAALSVEIVVGYYDKSRKAAAK